MNCESLKLIRINSSSKRWNDAKNMFFPSKIYSISTWLTSSISLYSRIITLLFVLFLSIPAYLNAQPGLEGTVQIRVNDPSVTVTVNKSTARPGDEVTITLKGLTDTKTAKVTVGKSFGGDEVEFQNGEGNTYTFEMPNYPVYIDVEVLSSSGTDVFYPLRIETPGVSSGKVTITVAGTQEGDVISSGSYYEVKEGTQVTATLKTPLASRLSLLSIRAYAPDGTWQSIPLIATGGTVPNSITFTMPATEVVIRFTIHEQALPDPSPDPTPVYYDITLPAVQGAVTDPVAGTYSVEAWNSFKFYLTLDKDYNQSEPVVTTDWGEVLKPRSSDGAYVLSFVRQDITIRIDGIRQNASVANEEIGMAAKGFSLHCEGNILYIRSERMEKAYIYHLSGALVRTVQVMTGVQPVTLPSGAYIVRMGEKSQKVIL